VRNTPDGQSRSRIVIAAAGALAAACVVAPAAAAASSTSPAAASSGGLHRTIHASQALKLTRVGTVNLSALAKASASPMLAGARGQVTFLGKSPEMAKAGSQSGMRTATGTGTPVAGVSTGATLSGNVTGAVGFDGVSSTVNRAVLGGDLTPPDMGMAAGTGPSGHTVIIQAVNSTLEAFSPGGTVRAGPISASDFFGIGPCELTATGFPTNCLSDPRVYWDPQTKHWFITDFTFNLPGVSPPPPPPAQFIAVSQTANGLGSYAIFEIPTGQCFISTADGQCLGDFDMVGADNSGFYISVNEFAVSGPFHGSVIFATSKSELISAANGGTVGALFVYTDPFPADPFAGFHLAPSQITQGSTAPNDEYFVESDANDFSNSSLEVFGLLGTSSLNKNVPPPLVATNVATEGYSVPPNATQKAGPIPLGTSLGAVLPSPLATDFDAVQQTVFADGEVYAQLNTGVSVGGGAANAGLAWFALHPTPGTATLSVRKDSNGYVALGGAHLVYPSIGVNRLGNGYMAFGISGADMFPAAAYIKFDDTEGAVGSIHVQKAGTRPLDDISCYPGVCRYGDYSATNVVNGRVFLATEYVHFLTNVAGGALTNWATRIWSVPDFSTAG
jgi:hypothetical protein